MNVAARKTFDLQEAVAIAYPTTGRQWPGKVHLMPVPKHGVALSYGIHIEGETALRALRDAVNYALGDGK